MRVIAAAWLGTALAILLPISEGVNAEPSSLTPEEHDQLRQVLRQEVPDGAPAGPMRVGARTGKMLANTLSDVERLRLRDQIRSLLRGRAPVRAMHPSARRVRPVGAHAADRVIPVNLQEPAGAHKLID